MVSSVNSSPARSCWLKLITSDTSISSRVKEAGREGEWETGREGDREGGLDTLVVSRIKIYFGEMK